MSTTIESEWLVVPQWKQGAMAFDRRDTVFASSAKEAAERYMAMPIYSGMDYGKKRSDLYRSVTVWPCPAHVFNVEEKKEVKS